MSIFVFIVAVAIGVVDSVVLWSTGFNDIWNASGELTFQHISPIPPEARPLFSAGQALYNEMWFSK